MARRLTKSNHTIHDNSGAFMGFDTLLEDSDNSDVEKGDTGKPIDEVNFFNKSYVCLDSPNNFFF